MWMSVKFLQKWHEKMERIHLKQENFTSLNDKKLSSEFQIS